MQKHESTMMVSGTRHRRGNRIGSRCHVRVYIHHRRGTRPLLLRSGTRYHRQRQPAAAVLAPPSTHYCKTIEADADDDGDDTPSLGLGFEGRWEGVELEVGGITEVGGDSDFGLVWGVRDSGV